MLCGASWAVAHRRLNGHGSTIGSGLNVLGLLLGSCGLLVGGCGTWGDGVLAHELRSVGAFTAIEVGNGIEATVTIGLQQPLDLSGDSNLLPLVQTTVEGGVLRVGLEPGTTIFPSMPLSVAITTPSLVAATALAGSDIAADNVSSAQLDIVATGGSVVVLTQLACADVAVAAEGGSRVTLSGTGQNISLTLSGASTITSNAFLADTLDIVASGASHGTVWAASSASGSLSGGSDLTVYGNPTTRSITPLDSSTVSYP